MNFFAELKRRNVFRVAAAYAVVAWLLVQLGDIAADNLGFPGWFMPMLFVLLGLGFPVALLLSWAFELTPEGVKRSAEVDQAESLTPKTGHRIDRLILIGLLAVIAVLVIERVWFSGAGQAPEVAASAAVSAAEPGPGAAAALDKSIAVLPFADFSPGGDQGWFADGLAEEILNALARTPDLLVSARTSSFRYKGSTLSIPEIATELRVAHVLEGSVRSTPQRIRVTAQLIRAADGFHLWSQNYDRDPADMIEIQEDLARQIATAMRTSMDPQALADMAQVGTRSVEAYQAYMRGVAMQIGDSSKDFAQAYVLFEESRGLDPTFAAAHARAADYWLAQFDPTATYAGQVDCAVVDCSRAFAERIDLAIRHAGSEIDRSAYRAQKALSELRLREAIELLDAVLTQRPGDTRTQLQILDITTSISDQARLRQTLDLIWPQAQVRLDAAIGHVNSAHRADDRQRAAEEALLLAQRWPDSASILYQAHRALLWGRRVEDARQMLARWQRTQNNKSWSVVPPARQACAEGRRADVEDALARLAEDNPAERWHLLMLLGRHDQASALLQPLERAGNTLALTGFLVYPQFDPTPFPSLMALLARENIERPPPVQLPFACPPEPAA